MTKRGLFCLLVVGIAVTAGACGGSSIDDADLERQVIELIETQIGVSPESADCPTDVEAGGRPHVRVHGHGRGRDIGSSNRRADRQPRAWSRSPRRSSTWADVESLAVERLSADADCPDLIVPAAGKTFTCSGTDAEGEPLKLGVTLENDRGRFSFDVSPSDAAAAGDPAPVEESAPPAPEPAPVVEDPPPPPEEPRPAEEEPEPPPGPPPVDEDPPPAGEPDSGDGDGANAVEVQRPSTMQRRRIRPRGS